MNAAGLVVRQEPGLGTRRDGVRGASSSGSSLDRAYAFALASAGRAPVLASATAGRSLLALARSSGWPVRAVPVRVGRQPIPRRRMEGPSRIGGRSLMEDGVMG
jgi:hypothetical protein